MSNITNIIEELKKVIVALENLDSNEKEFEELKTLLYSETWPEAILPEFICDIHSESDKLERAEGILDHLIDQPLSNVKFLDYGCGEGHTIKKLSNQGVKLGVGYDPIIKDDINFADNLKITGNFDTVKNDIPYDVILVCDVIDHAEDANKVMQELRTVSDENTNIYMRCHPWCSRHGGHLYDKINKAFAHFIFSEEELEKLGYKLPFFTIKTMFPMETYKKIFEENGFNIISENSDMSCISPIFEENKYFASRILKAFEKDEWPRWQLEQNFIDFVLKIKEPCETRTIGRTQFRL